MTEKRFEMIITSADGSFHYLDKNTGERITSTLELENKLNALHEENEQLKQRIKKLKKDVDALSCGEEYEQQLKDCTKLAKEEIRKEREDAAIRWANIGR